MRIELTGAEVTMPPTDVTASTIAIIKAHQEMLARLCKIKHVWCLPASKGH